MIIRPHGETNVTTACQNKCVGCNHFIPMQKPAFIDPAQMRVDLFMASRIVHFDRYNLVGGEPTLHPDILELIQIVRDSEIADEVEITTNGQSYQSWPEALYQALDVLIVTPYKLNEHDLNTIKEKCRIHACAFEIHPVIFTECAYKEQSPDDVAFGRYKACWYNVNRHVIDNGYFYRCCTAPFIPEVLLGAKKETDGIKLQGLTEQKLQEYLDSNVTPKSCYVCASNMGGRIEWRETTKDNWLNESVR